MIDLCHPVGKRKQNTAFGTEDSVFHLAKKRQENTYLVKRC